jgi:hypothetical protein
MTESGELLNSLSLVMRCKAGTDLGAPVRARAVGHRPSPRRPPPADSGSTLRRRSGAGAAPLRRDRHRPRSPATAPPGLDRLTPSVLPPPGHIPAAGASGSRWRRRRGGGRRRGLGDEERVGAGVGVVILDAAAVGRGADAAGAGAAGAVGLVGAVGGRGVVEGAASGGLERRRRHG